MWRYFVRVMVVAGVFGACCGSLVFSQPQAEAVRPRVVLTFPFENTGQEASIEWLSEGLAELTIERLNRPGYYLLSRQQRLDTLETAGLPVSTRFSRATMLKLGEEADADEVIFGQYSSDGSNLTVTARVLHLSPPSLSPEFTQSGLLSDLMSIHARLAGQLFCALTGAGTAPHDCGPSSPEALAFAAKLSAVAPAAFEAYIRGVTDSKEDVRLRNLRQAARLEPKWDAPAFAIGDTYFARRNCEMALPWLARVPGGSRGGISASFEAGVCYLLKNDPVKAQASFSDLLSRVSPQQLPEARSNLGVALAREGKFADARAAFEQATRVDTEEPAYWVNLGLVHLRAQDPGAAVGPLRRALSFQPNDVEARTLLAVALEQSGREEEAQAERATLQQASRRILMPRNPTSTDLTRFDRIRMRPDPGALRPAPLGQTESTDASDNVRGRQRIALHLERGRQFLESGNLDDAQRAFIEALLLAPLDADAHTGLAEVYNRQGRPNDGVREYRAALASRDDVETRVALAGLLLRQDRLAEARAELLRVLNRDPDNSAAQDLLDQLKSRSGSGGSP